MKGFTYILVSQQEVAGYGDVGLGDALADEVGARGQVVVEHRKRLL